MQGRLTGIQKGLEEWESSCEFFEKDKKRLKVLVKFISNYHP